MVKRYTTNTASLKATTINARKTDTKVLQAGKIKLDGKDILEYLKGGNTTILDERGTQADDDLDIWNSYVTKDEDDNVIVDVTPTSKEHDITTVTDEQISVLRSCSKVINNEVLDADDNHLMYWQTDGLTIGGMMVISNGAYMKSIMGYYFDLLSNLETLNTSLTIFNSDLSSLTDGSYMFSGCNGLTTFNSDLSSLTTSMNMFSGCNGLAAFNSDLSSLTNGNGMFVNCSNLATFVSNLSSLENGNKMFMSCPLLTTFESCLSSLTVGDWLFHETKLDAKSIANIIHTLPYNDGVKKLNITIGIGCDDTEADKLAFAQECDCETWQELLDQFSAKNWNAQFQFNGRPTTTYIMRRGETLPIYTKLEEVTDEKHYQYTSQDGSKFYNINYFHSTNGSTEGYDVFSSLEEAITTYNVTPKTIER